MPAPPAARIRTATAVGCWPSRRNGPTWPAGPGQRNWDAARLQGSGVDRLAAGRGWPTSWAGTPPNVRRALRSEQVTAATAGQVSELYERLWNQPPPAGTPRQRAPRPRPAGRRIPGWLPPMAWDDEDLDEEELEREGLERDEPGAAVRIRSRWTSRAEVVGSTPTRLTKRS